GQEERLQLGGEEQPEDESEPHRRTPRPALERAPVEPRGEEPQRGGGKVEPRRLRVEERTRLGDREERRGERAGAGRDGREARAQRLEKEQIHRRGQEAEAPQGGEAERRALPLERAQRDVPAGVEARRRRVPLALGGALAGVEEPPRQAVEQ